MALLFDVSETIDRPIEDVWKYLSDPSLFAVWMPGIESSRTQGSEPITAGSTFVFVARGAERTAQVVDFEPQTRISLRSVQGPITAIYDYKLSSVGKGTSVSLVADCSARGWGVLIAPLVRVLARRADQGQLVHLKAALMKT